MKGFVVGFILVLVTLLFLASIVNQSDRRAIKAGHDRDTYRNQMGFDHAQ